MDKNKDFIRIDDVFKEMKGVEAHGRQGSWTEMKSLLDKEMPVEKVAHRRWRGLLPIILPLVALLLLGGGALYFFAGNNDHNPKLLSNVEPNPENINAKPANAQPSAVNNSNHSPNSQPFTENTVAFSNTKNNNTLHAAPSDIALNRSAKTPSNRKTFQNKKNHNTTPIRTGKDNQKSKAFADNNRPNTPQSLSALNTKNKGEAKVAHRLHIPNHIAALQAALPIIRKDLIIKKIKPQPVTINPKPFSPANIQSITQKHHLTKMGTFHHQHIYQSQSGGLYKKKETTFKQVNITKRQPTQNNNIGQPQPTPPLWDTTSISKIARISFVPLTPTDIKELQAKPVINAHRQWMQEHSNDIATIKAQSSTKNENSFLDHLFSAENGIPSWFNGSTNWFLAFMFGGHVGIGHPDAYGLQIGASLFYNLGERWTLSLGLQYANGYYPNFQFLDQETTYDHLHRQKSPLGTQYSGTEHDKQISYKAQHLSELNFPVLFNYNLKRFTVFAGPQFAFFFPLKTTYSVAETENKVSELSYDNKNPFTNSYYDLNRDRAFDRRLGIGYKIGVRYDFSQRISIDLNINQTLWDNTGHYPLKALKKLYHQPAVQINFNYFLGRKEKIIYIMDKHHD